MITYFKKQRFSFASRLLVGLIIVSFLSTMIIGPQRVSAQNSANLPSVGTMVNLSPAFSPALIKGLRFYPNDPLRFDFILQKGDGDLQQKVHEEEVAKLIKYFLASLTVSEEDLWVNLSPYEGNRIIPASFGITDMGRDLLAQDYMLKQLTASLVYPEEKLGSDFWGQVYKKVFEKFGTTDIPANTFNKVWIVPDKAVVYENDGTAFIVETHLKVLLDKDYLALKENSGSEKFGTRNVLQEDVKDANDISSDLLKQIILPMIEKEVNEGKNFANLRQIYHSMLLATWFKRNLSKNFINQVYADQNKVYGIDIDKQAKQRIYDQYLEAFQKGVYDYVKEDYDPVTEQIIPRKYFSGGASSFSKVQIEQGNYDQLSRVTEGQKYETAQIYLRSIDKGDDKNGGGQHFGGDEYSRESLLAVERERKSSPGTRELDKKEIAGWVDQISGTLSSAEAEKLQQEMGVFFKGYQEVAKVLDQLLNGQKIEVNGRAYDVRLFFSEGQNAFSVIDESVERDQVRIYFSDLGGLIHEVLEFLVFPNMKNIAENQRHTLAFFYEGLAGGKILTDREGKKVIVPFNAIRHLQDLAQNDTHKLEGFLRNFGKVKDEIENKKFPNNDNVKIYGLALADVINSLARNLMKERKKAETNKLREEILGPQSSHAPSNNYFKESDLPLQALLETWINDHPRFDRLNIPANSFPVTDRITNFLIRPNGPLISAAPFRGINDLRDSQNSFRLEIINRLIEPSLLADRNLLFNRADAPRTLRAFSEDEIAFLFDRIKRDYEGLETDRDEYTFGFEYEFGVIDQNPDPKWVRRAAIGAAEWDTFKRIIMHQVRAILPSGEWQIDPGSANFQEIKTKNGGLANTADSWRELLRTLDTLQRKTTSQREGGPIEGGFTSIHMHIGNKSLTRNTDGRLNVDKNRLGRVVKVYESMIRALAGREWKKSNGTYTKLLEIQNENGRDVGGGVTSHSSIVNLSPKGTIEIKFFTGDEKSQIGEGQRVNTDNFKQRTEWTFNLLDIASSGFDAFPLVVLGLPVFAGNKPTQKQIDRFVELFFAKDARGAEYAKKVFAELNDEPAEASLQDSERDMLKIKAAYDSFGLRTVFDRHKQNGGYDENLVKYFLMEDIRADVPVEKNGRILELARDLVRAGATEQIALGYFPIEMHKKLREALKLVRPQVPQEDIRKPTTERIRDYGDIFQPARIENLRPEMISRVIAGIENDRFQYAARDIERESNVSPTTYERLRSTINKPLKRLTRWMLLGLISTMFLIPGDRISMRDNRDSTTDSRDNPPVLPYVSPQFQDTIILSKGSRGSAVEEYREKLLGIYTKEQLAEMAAALDGKINPITGDTHHVPGDPEEIVKRAFEKGTPFGNDLEWVTIAFQLKHVPLEQDGDVGPYTRKQISDMLNARNNIKYIPIISPVDNTGTNVPKRSDFSTISVSSSKDVLSRKVGGIDLNPANFNLQTQGAGVEFKFPRTPAELENLKIDGFVPIIINIIPATDLPLLIGTSEPAKQQQLSSAK